MKSPPVLFRSATSFGRIVFFLTFVLLTSALHADQVQMQNGDRYLGKITALNTNALVLQSDVLGNVRLPRSKVATITFGTNVVTNVSAGTNAAPKTNASVDQLAAHSDLIQRVQTQYLADAGPEANAKFNELITGLTTGKLNVNDLRAEAKKAADEVRELKRGLSEDESSSLDAYLSVLDKFVNETPEPKNPPATRPAPKAPIKPDSDEE